jgi:hydroxylamine reductase
MHCFQCEQGAGNACVAVGACGKTAEVGDLHDRLFAVARDVAAMAADAPEAAAARDGFVEDALFATMTNVNFDPVRVGKLIAAGERLLAGEAAARVVAFRQRRRRQGEEVAGLQELLTGGLKGLAAIVRQARPLGYRAEGVGAYLAEALRLLARADASAEELLACSLRCGEVALAAMEVLDRAYTDRLGHPEPTEVLMGHRPGKAILISGHELDQLERLLVQTAGRGIDVYTHGEMLSAHGYPALKRHAHLAGHYGGAWHDQRKTFAAFPGPVVMTGSCLSPPREDYRARMFTTGAMAHPALTHLADGDFAPAIALAESLPGFAVASAPQRHRVGFGHRTTLGVVDAMLDAVRAGEIRRFVLIGGCDGPTRGRGYYTRLAQALPADWVMLTLGCGKFRVLGRAEGRIGALPRLLDVGQCSDSFSAIKIARALAAGLGLDMHELPLNLVLSWHEQKAITILLSLLSLGLRNIRIGPRMPAFVTPALLAVLAERFGLMPIASVEQDLAAMAA